MSKPQPPAGQPECHRSQAQQMRLRLAKARLSEAQAVDLGTEGAASLIFVVRQLESALADIIRLAEEGCSPED